MSAKINLKKAREIVNEQILQNKIEELPNKAARDREIYANKVREEQQQAQQAQRQQQQRQSVVFNNRPNYAAQTTRANVGIKLQQAMAKNQNNDLDLQEIHKKNISTSKISPAKYKDTGKKYGDYFHENYEQYKDMPIYERDDGTYYLKTKNGYQKVGKLNKEGIVDKNIEKVDKKDLLKNYEQNKISDKESLEKAKKLGFKGTSVQKMSKKEVDRYWDNLEELQSRYKLTDKQVDEIWKENKIPNNIKKDDRSLKIVSELGKKLNSQINDDYKDLDIQNRIFLDTFKGSEKERRQMIDFLADTNHSEVVENQDKNAKWLKKSKYNLLENIIGTPGVIQERLATVANVGQKAAEGMGNFVEKAGDLLTEPLTLLEMIGNTKDVTTNRIGKKQFDHDLTQYEYRGKKYWYDPEENRLYEDGTHKEIKRFNLNVMKKTVGHDNPLANLGQAARETMTENDTQNLFEDNAIDKWIQKNTVLGQNIQSGIESTGEMLPLMAAGIATNNVTPEGTLEQGAKSLVTTNALVFGEAYSGAKTEALRQGMSVEDATKSAFVQAAAETISENFFDSIPGMSSAGWGDEIVSQIAGKFEQKLGSKAGRLMYHALSQSGEGLEEIVSNGLATMGNEILSYFDKNYASHFPELTGDMSRDMLNSMLSTESFDAFITATFTSMILNAGTTFLNNNEKNEIINDFAQTNGLTNKEAKQILKQNLAEELSTYTATGNFEDRLNAEQNATSKILGKMITNSVENHIELSDDGQSVKFYNKDLNYDEVNEKIDHLTEMITTVDDYDLKINLLEAASKLEIAKDMMLQQQEQIKPQEIEQKESEKINAFNQSIKNENIKDDEQFKGFKDIATNFINEKGYNIVFDSTLTNKEGRPVDAMISNENGITIKLNPKSKQAPEILIMHEITHAIDNEDITNLIVDYASKNENFNTALENLKKTYGTEEITPEIVATVSGEIFGDQNFINNLSTKKPNLFERIYNMIVSLANKITGNSREALFLKDLKNKWEKAYRESTIESAQQNLKNDVKYAEKLSGKFDNHGRELSTGMDNFMKNSKVRVDEKSDGELVEVFHTVNFKTQQFNVFNPMGSSFYRFGDNFVTYFTDSEDMSGSYADQDYVKADSTRYNNVLEVQDFLDKLNSIKRSGGKFVVRDVSDKEGYSDAQYIIREEGDTWVDKTIKFSSEEDLLKNFKEKLSKKLDTGKNKWQYEGYLNITNPYIVDADGKYWNQVEESFKEDLNNQINEISKYSDKLYDLAIESNRKYREEFLGETSRKVSNVDRILSNSTDEILRFLYDSDLIRQAKKYNVIEDIAKSYGEKIPDSNTKMKDLTNAATVYVIEDYGNEYEKAMLNMNLGEFFNISHELLNAKVEYGEEDSWFRLNMNDIVGNNKTDMLTAGQWYHLARNNFSDSSKHKLLYSALTTNDVVKKILASNANGETNYDGVIFKNVIDYGGHSETPDVPNNVYVTFSPEQFKSIDNVNPTNDIDWRYSQEAGLWYDFVKEIAGSDANKTRTTIEFIKNANKNIMKFEKLKAKQSENEIQSKKFEEEKHKKVAQLDKQLNELRENKKEQISSAQLDRRISKQRAIVDDLGERMRKERSQFGMVDEKLKSQSKLANEKLTELLDQKRNAATIDESINEKIKKVKKQIEEVESSTFEQKPNSLEQIEKPEVNEDTTKKEITKNTINEKIEKTDEKITVKPNEKNIRSWAETASKGDYKGVDLVKEVSDKIDHMYVPEHNVPHWNKAVNTVESEGYKNSMGYLKTKINSNKKMTLDDVMLGEKLLSEAARNKNYEDVTYLLTELEILGTEMGQNIQALSVIRRLSPEGQLRILQRTISRMKSKGIKGAEDLHLTNDMVDLIENSTEEDLNKNVDSIKKLLGEQMTGSLEEKLRTWRYFAMLGNPKTHVRNIISNVGMMATRFLKKLHQRALESAVAKINPDAIPERRISFNKISQEVKDHVDNFIKDNISLLAKESKYKMESQIEQYKKIYGNSMAGELANKITEFNSNLLENEDLFFKLPAFKNAVGEFLVANGINTVEDIETHENMFNKAVDYGVDEALKATFQQYSAFASWLNTLSKKNKTSQILSEAIMPFKRTPINIVKTGVSYSPLGLLKTVTKNSMDLKNGKISVNEYIDNLSQGLTGTELMMLGLVLSKMGILGGKAGDADKEAQFKKAQGKQNYSINIGNFSYNIDWLVPTSVPLLLGVTMNEIRNENTSMNLNTLMPIATSIADPIIELSFLQTLDNALSTYGREGLQGSIEDTLQSYVGQYVPTIFGQVAKTIDPTVRSTSASKNSSWKWGEETLRQIGSKIPGVTYALEPSKDMWGEDVKRDGNPLIRAFNNFFNPGSPETIPDDTVNKEIQNIYDQTHEDSVIPKLPSTYYYGLKKDVTYKGEKYVSNAKEYTEMKEIYGKTAYDILNKLFKTSTYKNSSDEDKVKLIEKAYTHATDTMKKEFLSKKGVDYKNKTGYFFYKKLDEPVYEENAIKYVAEHDVDLSTAYKANKKKS